MGASMPKGVTQAMKKKEIPRLNAEGGVALFRRRKRKRMKNKQVKIMEAIIINKLMFLGILAVIGIGVVAAAYATGIAEQSCFG